VFFTVIFNDYFEDASAPTRNRRSGPVSDDACVHRSGDRVRRAAVGV